MESTDLTQPKSSSYPASCIAIIRVNQALQWVADFQNGNSSPFKIMAFPSGLIINVLLLCFVGHKGRVLHVALSPDCSRFISLAADGMACVWKYFQSSETRHRRDDIQGDYSRTLW